MTAFAAQQGSGAAHADAVEGTAIFVLAISILVYDDYRRRHAALARDKKELLSAS